MPTVSDALKQSARPLGLMGVFAGVATFAALPMITPHYHSGAAIAENAVLAALAAMMFGAAWIIAKTSLKGSSLPKGARRPRSAKKMSEPLLTSMGDAPLLREADTEVKSAHEPIPDGELKALSVPTPREDAPMAPVYSEIDALATRLKARRPSGGGHRTLITAIAEPTVPFKEALELTKALADSGAQTVLVDWSPSAQGFARTIGLDMTAGWNDLLCGRARFDEIIQRLPGMRAHAIASGKKVREASFSIDADLLNLALDALDEVYDHIVVAARHDEARLLFETIEGRFDAGITVGSDTEIPLPSDAFIGFDVTDIDVLHYQRSGSVVTPMAQRIALATRPREPVARRA